MACLLGALMLYALLVAGTAGLLPESVATHFDSSGNANGWMPRPQHLVVLSMVAVAIPLLIILFVRLGCLLPPRFFNLPNAEFWRKPENFPTACKIAKDWGNGFAAMMVLWGAVLHVEILLANREVPPFFPPSSAMRLVLFYLAGLFLTLSILIHAFRIPKPDSGARATE